MVVSYSVGASNQTQVLWKSKVFLNHWTISIASISAIILMPNAFGGCIDIRSNYLVVSPLVYLQCSQAEIPDFLLPPGFSQSFMTFSMEPSLLPSASPPQDLINLQSVNLCFKWEAFFPALEFLALCVYIYLHYRQVGTGPCFISRDSRLLQRKNPVVP